MTAHIKTFLLWLLIAALPLQGLAAAGAPQCGSAHHHAAMDIHATDAAHADSHRAAPCSQDADQASSQDCQACCIGSSLPPSGINWTLPQHQADRPQTRLDTLYTGHIAGGIERPPRLS